jgi:3-mercaptopyruvate sulfurtransferase SseA
MSDEKRAYLRGGIDAWNAAARLLETGTPRVDVAKLAKQNAADIETILKTMERKDG